MFTSHGRDGHLFSRPMALQEHNFDGTLWFFARNDLRKVGAGIDLQLSGHTHAGQLWPLRYLVPLQRPSIEGLVTVAGIPVFTTRGAGTWGPPVRVGAEPEVSMLELSSVGA